MDLGGCVFYAPLWRPDMVSRGGSIKSGTGTMAVTPLALAVGANTITATGAGTFLVSSPFGATVATGTATITGSPVTVSAGTTATVTTGVTTGNFTVTTNNVIHSKDRTNHLCTITGTTWSYQGRVWDGNDVISASTVTAGGFFGGAHTLIAWANLGAWANNREIISACKADLASYSMIGFATATKKFTCNVSKAGVGENIVTSSGTYNNDTNWHFLASTVDADGHINHFLVDGVDMGTTSTFTNDISNIDGFYMGALVTATNVWYGTIGEGLVYNRELSLGEIEKIRQATKWRYT